MGQEKSRQLWKVTKLWIKNDYHKIIMRYFLVKREFIFFYIFVLPQMLFEVFLQVYIDKSLMKSIQSFIFIALIDNF